MYFSYEKKDLQSAFRTLPAGLRASLTSCDSETITNILTNLLYVVLSGNGDTYTYSGTADFVMYDLNSEHAYLPDTKQTAKANINVEVTPDAKGGTVTIALGDLTIGSTKIQHYSFTTYYKEGVIDPTDMSPEDLAEDGRHYLTGGSCTLNGKPVEANSSSIQGTITGGQNSRLDLTYIYFEVGGKMCKGTFSGTNATFQEE